MLYDCLKKLSDSGIYPFHMPGHKRNITDDNIPYSFDLTEIDGFDNLHNPTGCIKSVMQKACSLYSVKYAYLLINGTTGGLLSAVRSLTNYGDTVIMARNCHKSVYNAVEICGLNAEYVFPKIDKKIGIFSSINPIDIENLLIKNPNAKLVIITSPTYEGIVSDVRSIAEICRRYNAKLLVDEAHGAHFPFSSEFPSQAIHNGADISVVSLHKTLPSLTQTALLFTNDDSLTDKIEENLAVFETSSPSYILMCGIEKCLDYISNNISQFKKYTEFLDDFYSNSKSLEKLRVYIPNNNRDEFFDFDKSKILIFTSNTNISGVQLAKILREKYLIETEMSYTDYAIAMTSVCDTQEGFNRLYTALVEIDKTIDYMQSQNKDNVIINKIKIIPEKIFKSSNKYNFNSVTLQLNNAENRVSLEYIWAYPPGIPLLVPGEVISSDLIRQINELTKNGVEVYSTYKNAPKLIKVVDD